MALSTSILSIAAARSSVTLCWLWVRAAAGVGRRQQTNAILGAMHRDRLALYSSVQTMSFALFDRTQQWATTTWRADPMTVTELLADPYRVRRVDWATRRNAKSTTAEVPL